MGAISQLINFGVFLSSLILFLNNLFDFKFKAKLVTELDDNIPVANDIALLVCSFLVMYMSIVTPFEVSVVKNFGERIESFFDIIFFTAMLYTSTTIVIDDPSVLISTTFEAFSVISDELGGIDLAISTNELNIGSITLFSFMLIQAVNLAKIYLIAASGTYLFYIVWNTPTYSPKSIFVQFRQTFVPRFIILFILSQQIYKSIST